MLRTLFDGSFRHFITFALILLLILVLILPPISLPERLGLPNLQNMVAISQGGGRIEAGVGGMIADTAGVAVIFFPEHVTQGFQVSLGRVPNDRLANLPVANRAWQSAVDALQPAGLVPLGDLIEIRVDEAAQPAAVTVRVPLPEDPVQPETLKLVTWRDERWEILPSTLIRSEVLLESSLNTLPDNVLLVKDNTSHLATVALLLEGDQIPAPSQAAANVDYVGIHYTRLRGDGGLEGSINPLQSETTPFYLAISNVQPDGVVRSDLLINMLLSPGQIENQMNAIREAVETYGFQGVFLDYRGLSLQPGAGPQFTAFVQRLKAELQALDRSLAVRVEMPRPISAEAWDTLGYEWTELGQTADSLVIPTPINPENYRPGAYPFESLLQFAAGRIERHKLAIALVPNSVARINNTFVLRPFTEAVSGMMGKLELQSADSALLMRMNRDHLRSAPVYDPVLYQFRYAIFGTDNMSYEVHVSDAASLRYQLGTLWRYNIPHVVLDLTGYVDVDPNVWTALSDFKSARIGDDLLPTEYKIQYEIAQDGERKASLAAPFLETDRRFPLEASGTYLVEATMFIDGTLQESLQDTGEIQASLVAPRAVQSPNDPVATEPLLVPGPDSNLVARNGPGNSNPQTEVLVKGQPYDIVGRNNDTTWIQIEDERGPVGWVTVIEASAFIQNPERIQELPVTALRQAALVNTPSAPAGTATPSHLWGYGVQAHLLGVDAEQALLLTQQLGFNWVKQQIRWQDFAETANITDWSSIDPVVGVADRRNISLLFSVLAAPDWAREPNFDASVVGPPADPATFARFLSQMASRYCGRAVKAIEIWNEQNLHYEWGNLPLSPADYVRMLRLASESIRRECPSMLVISGALTPAGNNGAPTSRGGTSAVDDVEYLRQMLQQGALNYVDAVGAHPSGYNVPPYATLENYCQILTQTGNANFGSGCERNSPHRSFSFQSTMLSYRELVAQYDASKPIWPTEFGWAVSAVPYANYGYALDNTYQEQAEWTVQAYTMMKEWGWVAAPILWNLNFRVIAPGTEREQWGIVNTDWTPLPVYDALKAMPK